MYVGVAAFIYTLYTKFRKAFNGEIDEKPYDRQWPTKKKFGLDPAPLYEILSSNGKYYLRRLYGVEIIESAYQINNFGLFACRLGTAYLLIYCGVMAGAAIFQLWQVRNVRKPIDNTAKKKEVISDMYLELWCTAFPLIIIYFVHGIYFTEFEIVQILFVPFFALVFKIRLVINTEIVLVLDDIKEFKKTAYLPERERKKRRRTSFAQREQALKDIQNEKFGIRWRVGLLFFYVLFALFYSTMFFVQVGNVFLPQPAHYVYCKVNVPSCTHWFYGVNNCLSISHLRTTDEPSDPILKKFSRSTAAVAIEVSNLHVLKLLEQFKLHGRMITIFKSNAPRFDIDWNGFKELITVNFNSFNATTAHTSFYENSVRRLTYSDMPNMEIKDFKLPNTEMFELIRVGTRLKRIEAPVLFSLTLMNYGIDELPAGLNLKGATALKLAFNNFTSVDIPTTYVLDLRYNRMTKFQNRAQYSYAHGNPSCPDGWICDEFCHPYCSNYIHMTVEEKSCTLDCVRYCGKGMCKNFIN
tara:strand:+ start:509 stop:2083 length:1575 start_codon:yes stop_codon:yes gene_type:complete